MLYFWNLKGSCLEKPAKSTHQAAKLQHQNKVKCLCFSRLLCKQCVKFWRLLKFSLVFLYVLGQGTVTMFSLWIKAVNRCTANGKLWVEDIQHFIYFHTEVGRNLNCVCQVTITPLRVSVKHLVVSVSRKVLEKPSSEKISKLLPLLYDCFLPKCKKKKKIFAILRKFSSWQSVQRSRESICQQTSFC